MDNSIRLKELQIINGALRKGDERLGFCFSFVKNYKRVFFVVKKGGWGNPTAFRRKVFLKGLGQESYFWYAC
jgi:hypothetical protein